MGEPLRIESASAAPWMSLKPERILLLCADADRAVVELARPQLELQRLRVDVVTDAFDPDTVLNALEAAACPTVVAVVVSRARVRRVARPLIDAFSEVTGPYNRLFVLDLRRQTSVLEQVRALSEAVEGLELTLAIGRESQAALTTSASVSPRVSGERRLSPCATGTRRLRVVEPPVLLDPAVHAGSQTVPAGTRFRLSSRGSGRRSRDLPATSPDLPRIE